MSTTAGYSGTPLLKKLGLLTDMKVILIGEPADYMQMRHCDISKQLCSVNDKADFIHLFVKSKLEFETNMNRLERTIHMNDRMILWISWYKKSAKIFTDITETNIREYALKHGLVDVKVCVVNEIWSGLKLVVPLALRSKK